MRREHYILYALALLVASFGYDARFAYCNGSEWWTHLTFHFAHGNIFHLAANLLAMFYLSMRKDGLWVWIVSYIAATLCSFIACSDKHTLGLSGFIFVYYGIIFMKESNWKNLLTTLIYMAVSCAFARKMAIYLHFICLFFGVLIGGFSAAIKEIKRKEDLYG